MWGFSDSFIKASSAGMSSSPAVLTRGVPMTRHRMQNEGGGEGTSHAPSGGEEVRYALKCSISMKWIVTIEVRK